MVTHKVIYLRWITPSSDLKKKHGVQRNETDKLWVLTTFLCSDANVWTRLQAFRWGALYPTRALPHSSAIGWSHELTNSEAQKRQSCQVQPLHPNSLIAFFGIYASLQIRKTILDNEAPSNDSIGLQSDEQTPTQNTLTIPITIQCYLPQKMLKSREVFWFGDT